MDEEQKQDPKPVKQKTFTQAVKALSRTIPVAVPKGHHPKNKVFRVMFGDEEIEDTCKEIYAVYGEKIIPHLEATLGGAVTRVHLAKIKKAFPLKE